MPQLPHKMLAAQVIQFRTPHKLQQAPVPKDLAPNDLLIKVAVASLCHTNFMVQEGIMGTTVPCTASHEGAGAVVATGSVVNESDFKIGDRVMAGILYHPCGICSNCQGPEKYSQYCAHISGYLGVTMDGFFAEYARDEGLELTKKGGADIVIDVRIGHDKVVEEIKKVTNGKGAAATVNVSDAPKAMATSCAITMMHGTVIQLAQPDDVVIPFRELIFRDIRVRGSLICSPEEGQRMLQVVDEHRISVDMNPFNGLDEIAKLIELAKSGKMKGKGIIIVDPEQIKKEKESGLEMV
ncbi:GroES-like protein [Lojkania enalia]|uniref:GroES-like protein n=1 Tax=Lojkania enalia TaxID=147567 RepID=A0A9P4KHP8_9PLEO|nr:GroES-like protein [Didymosphaeria enalia]